MRNAVLTLIAKYGDERARQLIHEAAERLYADAKEVTAAWRSGNVLRIEEARRQLECTLTEIDCGAP